MSFDDAGEVLKFPGVFFKLLPFFFLLFFFFFGLFWDLFEVVVFFFSLFLGREGRGKWSLCF